MVTDFYLSEAAKSAKQKGFNYALIVANSDEMYGIRSLAWFCVDERTAKHEESRDYKFRAVTVDSLIEGFAGNVK